MDYLHSTNSDSGSIALLAVEIYFLLTSFVLPEV